MRLFSGLPKPTYDEVFTSWAYRCSIKNCLLRDYLRASQGMMSRTALNEKNFDPDFDEKSEFYLNVCRLLEVDIQKAWSYFKPGEEGLTPWNNRVHFCCKCLQNDIAERRLPSWRKSWCYSTSIQCLEHRIELLVSTSNSTLDKAWQCFSQALNYPPSADRWSALYFVRRRAILVSRLMRSKYIAGNTDLKMTKDLQVYFAAIYTLSLSLRTYHYAAGWAVRLTGFHKKIHRIDECEFYLSITKGPGLSCPRQRFIAALMACWILELAPNGALRSIFAKLRSVGVKFPTNIYLLGCEFLTLFTEDEYEFVVSLFGSINHNEISSFELFMKGLKVNGRIGCSGQLIPDTTLSLFSD